MNKQNDQTPNNLQEHFFTVTSTAKIRYSSCTEAMVNDELWPDTLTQTPAIVLLETLRNMEFETRPTLKLIGETDRYTEQYLRNINKRIELIASYITQSDNDQTQSQEIQISEAAVSFTSEKSSVPEVGSILAIELVLLPSYIPLSLYGKITAIKANHNNQTQVTVYFYQLKDNDRLQLAKHVLQKQREDNRKRLL